MKIFDPENIFREEAIRESENLVNQLKKITGPADQFDDAIFSASEAVRRCEIVQSDPAILAAARVELDKALRKKRDCKVQVENQRNAILRGLEEINKPVILYLCECADESIGRVWRVRIFQHSGLESNVFTGKMATQVESNLSKVHEIRSLLLNFKSKIHSMAHSPLKEIQILTQEISEKVNIDLRKTEVVTMSLYEAQGIESDLKERPSIPIPPRIYEDAQKGRFQDAWEETLMKYEKAKKTFLSMLP